MQIIFKNCILYKHNAFVAMPFIFFVPFVMLHMDSAIQGNALHLVTTSYVLWVADDVDL